MTVCVHEIKRGRLALALWTGVLAFLILVCMALYPEMKEQMAGINALFSNMGSFTAAFGMDKVSFGEIMGFYAIECGNILGLGGAFFAALLGITALAEEERAHTAEFLLTHPVSRRSVGLQKYLAVILQLMIMNGVIVAVSVLSFQVIGENIQVKEFVLLHFAFLIMQIETAGICLGISAFLRGNTMGLGLGIAAVFYFLNLIRNISGKAEFLRWLTPFAYADASDIVAKGGIDEALAGLGLVYMVIGIFAGMWYYSKKDITA